MNEADPNARPDAESAPRAGTAPPGADLAPEACAAALAQRFAALFGPGVAKPLKLRIQADIQQRAPGVFTRRALSAFLHRHTTSTAYLKALAKATHRFDLDGVEAGELAAEHRDAALAELERRRGLHRQRQRDRLAAERNARREQAEAEGGARAERAALLRAYEASTVSRQNFCALKGVAETALDALLEQARRERMATLAAGRGSAAAAGDRTPARAGPAAPA